MKPASCARGWQAEAAEDGRLSKADAASFERHVTTCTSCAEEVRALATLRDTAARLPVPSSTELHRRRQRNELLRAANELLVSSRRPRWRVPAAAAFALAVLAGIVFVDRGGESGGPAPGAAQAAAPVYRVVTASKGARFGERERGPVLRVAVEQGLVEIAVDPLRGDQRFLVELPDGEIEVRGTQFAVDVALDQTRSVRVTEGSIALRIRDRAPLMLRAGERWSSAGALPGIDAAPALGAARAALARGEAGSAAAGGVAGVDLPGAPTAPSPRASSDTSLTRRRDTTPKVAPTAPTPEPGFDDPPPAAPTAGEDFAAAMSAFSAGDYGEAERRLLAFERRHRDDARAEDATFLRAVARLRRGDREGARALARDYLRRFPEGLRRAEAERIAR